MLFKHNASRRHHIPKARRRVTNWPAYEAGLRRRGDLTLWLNEAALAGWHAPRRTTRGGQPVYAELTIELVLTLRLVFHLALRQAEGFARSVLRLLGLDVRIPDHSTLSRRGRAFAGRQPRAARHDELFHGFCRKFSMPTIWYRIWALVWLWWMMAIEFKGSHFERDVILWGVRWYVAYPLSYRQVEEMMQERGVEVDHSTLHRWVLKYVPALEKVFLARKRPVGGSWRMDETYVRIKGMWKYLYRAVDKTGATIDFLLTARRDRKAALRFLHKAAGRHGVPQKVTIDKSGTNTAAIESYNTEHDAGIEIRQIKHINNIVEQDHRAIKRMTRPMLGFKSFWSAAITLAGIEIMHMIRKGQLRSTGKLRPAQQFYSLAG